MKIDKIWDTLICWHQFNSVINPLNVTGSNMQQVAMLTDNYGIEMVNMHVESSKV